MFVICLLGLIFLIFVKGREVVNTRGEKANIAGADFIADRRLEPNFELETIGDIRQLMNLL